MLNELNQLKYTNRLNRLQKLIALDAPPWLVANECALVAGAVYDILEPINLLREHAGADAPRYVKLTSVEELVLRRNGPTNDLEVVGDGDNPENES